MKCFAAFFLLLLWFAGCGHKTKHPGTAPNIIIIYADDLGYGDLGIYGGDIPTPHIDRIGREGVRFTDFYVAGPVCTPSRFGLLTGSYPLRSKHKLWTALMPFDEGRIDTSETTVADYLKRKNYSTALIGKWHLGSEAHTSPTDHGFDLFTGFTGGCIDFFTHTYASVKEDWYVDGKPTKEEGYATDLITGHAIQFLEKQRKSNKPFFLYLPYNAPHYGKSTRGEYPAHTLPLKEDTYQNHTIVNTLQAPEEYYQRFPHIADPYRQAYAAMVSSLDDNIGKLTAYLEREGLLDKTMIWFISDNGGYAESYFGHADNGPLRGQKGTLLEGGIRVPALLWWKNNIRPGQEITSPVANIDLVPTFAALLDFKEDLPADQIDGVDISDLLFSGETADRVLIWQFKEQHAIRQGDWKLLNGAELYHLKSDTGEKRNLATEHPKILEKLKNRYKEITAGISH